MKSQALFLAAALTPALCLSTIASADVANEPPSVQITSPTDGQSFDGPLATIDVVLDAYEGDDGIASIMLRIDGATAATDTEAPYGFEGVEVGEGMHELLAIAVSDYDQSQHVSLPVSIVVFGAGGTGDDTPDAEPEASKCSVAAGSGLGTGGGAMLLLGLLSLGVARRRREG